MSEEKKECPSCRKEIDDYYEVCPHCDYKIPKGQTKAYQTGYSVKPIAATPSIKSIKPVSSN